MSERGSRRLRGLVAAALVVAFGSAGTASADSFGRWSGQKGAFAWESKRTACGVVGESPSSVRAHTRWRTSPANGYLRLTFTREIRDPDTGEWKRVQLQRHSTRNTAFEGNHGVLHWTQWFEPFEDEAGLKSRHRVVLQWLRDRPGRDRQIFRRERLSLPCTVGG